MSKKTMRKVLGFAFGTAAAWAVAVKPRIWGKPDLSEIRRYDYARRGFFDPVKKIPENSLASCRAAIEHGYGITMDVRITRDGVPVLFHDERIYRMTGIDGTIENCTLAELRELKLGRTEETIPTLQEALELVDGQVPVLLELHVSEGNYETLCDLTCDVLDVYEGVFAVQAFDPRVLRWFRQQRNEYIRGQLVDYNHSSGISLKSRIWDFFSASLFMNFLTEPDMISYNTGSRINPSLWICRVLYNTLRLEWTVKSMDEYERVRTDGSIAIFEAIEP